MSTKKIKVDISFEIDLEDLEDLRSSIYALCSNASYYDLDSGDGKEYYPYWVHDLVDNYNGNIFVNKEERRVFFQNDPTTEVFIKT
tara:strand:+ start:3095 stop:3352 length:258 start_codon:yes stop_codon:yes gene_type:complete